MMKTSEIQYGQGFARLDGLAKSGMISRWLLQANSSVFPTHTGSTDSVLAKRCAVSSVIAWHASSRWFGAQKNGLQGMWSTVLDPRSQGASRSRSAERRCTDLPGTRSSSGPLSMRWQRERRTTELSGGQPSLHEALRVVRRSSLSREHDQGCG